MKFHLSFKGFVGVIMLLIVIAQAQTSEQAGNDERLAQTIINSISPEMQASYEEQKELYKKNHPVTPFMRFTKYTAFKGSGAMVSQSDVTRVLILLNKTLYEDQTAKEKIDRYCTDFSKNLNCTVEVEVTEGGEPSEVKNLIKDYYTNGGLDGVIIIGDQPVQNYYLSSKRFDRGSFICDLYFMDLDGSWENPNSQGAFARHVDGSGDIEPEVFVARIHPSTMSYFGDEVELLSTYLDKNHEYWLGNIPIPQKAATFIQETWVPWAGENDVHLIYGKDNSDMFHDQNNANSTAFINNGLKGDYSFVHLWCHSNIHGHSFDFGGSISDVQLYEIESNPIGYGIDACYIGAWESAGGKYISGAYVFNKSKRALAIVSGSRSGQSIGSDGKLFYEELGENICFGKAFSDWMDDFFHTEKGNSDQVSEYLKGWHYGYHIIGDPMVCFKEVPTAIEGDNGVAFKPEYSLTLTNSNYDNIKISYTLPHARFVTLKLYTMNGKCTKTLISTFKNRGHYKLSLPTDSDASGLYLLVLDAGSHSVSQKLQILH